MKTSLLKSLDGILHLPACVVASFLPKPHRDGPSGKTLIVRPGGMGDLICADMALQELSLAPHDFTWLIEGRSRPWATYRDLPHVCYDEAPWKTLKRVWNQYSLVINTEQRFGLTEAYALLARTRSGRVISFATNRGARWSDVKIPYDWRDEHETTAFARLFAGGLGCPYGNKAPQPRPRLYPSSHPPLVLIAGRQSPSRRLSLEKWVALITPWHRQRPFLIGAAPEDAEFANQLTRLFPGQARRFEGAFASLCEQIARSEEIFTMDGGAAHIASYFGIPALTLFTSGRDRKWRPLGEGSRVLRRHDLPCQPCTRFGQVPPCPYEYACLNLDGNESEGPTSKN